MAIYFAYYCYKKSLDFFFTFTNRSFIQTTNFDMIYNFWFFEKYISFKINIKKKHFNRHKRKLTKKKKINKVDPESTRIENSNNFSFWNVEDIFCFVHFSTSITIPLSFKKSMIWWFFVTLSSSNGKKTKRIFSLILVKFNILISFYKFLTRYLYIYNNNNNNKCCFISRKKLD